MGYFSEVAKNEALDGVTVNRMLLHYADPGSDGTANIVNQTDGETPMDPEAVTFNEANEGERYLSASKTFTGLEVGTAVTWVSVWEDDTVDIFKGRAALTGDTIINSEGEFIVKDTTKITIEDLVE